MNTAFGSTRLGSTFHITAGRLVCLLFVQKNSDCVISDCNRPTMCNVAENAYYSDWLIVNYLIALYIYGFEA